MSKEAAVRAMREARYAERATRSPADRASVRPALPRAKAESATVTDTASAASEGADALCGHRSMNGRTCTREQGHSAKSHRYS